MDEKKRTIYALVIIVTVFIGVIGVLRIVNDKKASQIRNDFDSKTQDFKDTVNDTLHDPLVNAHLDVIDAETTGEVRFNPVHYRDGFWYEFNTYIYVKLYVSKDMSKMDPYEVRGYLEPLDDCIDEVLYDYQKNNLPFAYYRTDEGVELLSRYLYGGETIFDPLEWEVYVIDAKGDEYRYAGHYAYYVNGECVEKPFLYQNSSSSSSSGGSSSHHNSSGSYYDSSWDHAWDVDDYDNPDEYADDAWGEDFDDWDDAYDYWEDNY